MKSASTALVDFLLGATAWAQADLYTFTLNGGTVLRYSGANMPISVGGNTFNLGPPISDAGVQSQRGVQASAVDITVLGDERFLIGSEQFLDFVLNLGLDGATVRIDRAFAANWSEMATAGPVGAYQRFYGRFSEAKELGQTQVVISATDFRDTLGQTFPGDMFQTSCINTFGDANCTKDVAALTVNGAVAGSGMTQTAFDSNLSQADGYFTLGALTFTSGVNEGVSRSVKAYANASGALQVVAPFPSAPVAGDTFTVTPGCALSTTACTAWGNLIHFRGEPFIPPPATGLPS